MGPGQFSHQWCAFWFLPVRLEKLPHPREVARGETAHPGLAPLNGVGKGRHGALAPAIGSDPHADVFTDARAQIGQRGIGRDKCPVVVSGEGFRLGASLAAQARNSPIRSGNWCQFDLINRTDTNFFRRCKAHSLQDRHARCNGCSDHPVCLGRARPDRMVGSTRKASKRNDDGLEEDGMSDGLFPSKAIVPFESDCSLGKVF